MNIQNTIPFIENNTIKFDQKTIILFPKKEDIQVLITQEELYLDFEEIEKKEESIFKTKEKDILFFQLKPNSKNIIEAYRRKGALAFQKLGRIDIQIKSFCTQKETLAFIEGYSLASYKTSFYKKKYEPNINIKIDGNVDDKEITKLNAIIEGVFLARDLVNTPRNILGTEELKKEIETIGELDDVTFSYLDEEDLEKQGFNGILSVGKGSNKPSYLTQLNYTPKGSSTTNPLVLIGKGVTYDTGGLSLKPTPDSMDFMKSDMGGAASVIGTFLTVVKLKLPINLICIVPIVENWIGENAFAPGDVIYMHNGTSVEVMNTDAEGRLILADALSYSQEFEPCLTIDLATLTGAAARILGSHGTIFMGNAHPKIKQQLIEAGNDSYERVVELPLWDEYNKMLESDIADLNNIGGPFGGAITAGKFLENFIGNNWLHLDIAGSSYIKQPSFYHTIGGTGVGVRLLTEFIQREVEA